MNFIGVAFALYIFECFGLLRIAKLENYKFPYMVWIAGLSHYVSCKYCMDNTKSIVYAIMSLFNFINTVCLLTLKVEINGLFLIYGIIYFIVDMLVMNRFYKEVYKKLEIFTISTIITFDLLKSIFIYISRIRKITNEDL